MSFPTFEVKHLNRSSNENSLTHISILISLCIGMFGAMTTWFSMTAVLPEVTEMWSLNSTSVSLITIAVQAGFW